MDWLLVHPLGIRIAYSPIGITIALIFIGLPFVVRTVQPVMEEIDREVEEAAATLGANRFQTVFQVLLPSLAPRSDRLCARLRARSGRIWFGRLHRRQHPYVSEIAPLLIVIRLEFNYAGATAIATIMLVISFAMLLVINLIQAWSRRRYGLV